MTDEEPLPVPYRWTRGSTPDVSEVRYPATTIPQPPPELGRRGRRRFRRAAHQRRRADTKAVVAGWRSRVPDDAGLAVGGLLVAAVFAAVVFWPHGDPTPGAQPPAAVDAPSRVGASTPRSNPEAGDVAPAPTAPAGLFGDADGKVAYSFVLDYVTYSPAAPDPVDTWVDSWRADATDALVASANSDADALWAFTVRQAVHVIDPSVLSGTRDGNTWQLQVLRHLFPIGGDEQSVVLPQQVTVTLVVTGGRVAVASVAR